MAKQLNQRLKLFHILNYLMENTDEEHFASSGKIMEHLENKYNIPLERRTVYSDINLLMEYGEDANFEIEYNHKEHGYNIIYREFDLLELQLLIDGIQSSKFITEKTAKEITDKLKRFTSRYNRPVLDRRAYVTNRIRNENESAFYGIDSIHLSIAQDKKISFRYFYYNENKAKTYRKKGEPYIASPYALLWNDDNYYLLAFEGKKIKHFRVDKMEKVEQLEEPREGKEAFKAINLSEWLIKVFSMYGGKEENVTLRFSDHKAGVVIDRYGSDITLIPDGGKHFKINVAVEVSDQFYAWLCGFGKAAKILSPAHVVEGMYKHVDKIRSMYESDIEL